MHEKRKEKKRMAGSSLTTMPGSDGDLPSSPSCLPSIPPCRRRQAQQADLSMPVLLSALCYSKLSSLPVPLCKQHFAWAAPHDSHACLPASFPHLLLPHLPLLYSVLFSLPIIRGVCNVFCQIWRWNILGFWTVHLYTYLFLF